MALTEIFKSRSHVATRRVVVNNDHVFKCRAEIGGRDITFMASKDDYEDLWQIEFYEKLKSGNITFGATGSGAEFKVFSFVIDCLEEFVARHRPLKIVFSADKDEPQRIKLYLRMLRRLVLPGYREIKSMKELGSDFEGYDDINDAVYFGLISV